MRFQPDDLRPLFAQLGLPTDEAGMRQFIATHTPLAADLPLADAPFWSPEQARFLHEQSLADAEWAIAIDRLNLALH